MKFSLLTKISLALFASWAITLSELIPKTLLVFVVIWLLMASEEKEEKEEKKKEEEKEVEKEKPITKSSWPWWWRRPFFGVFFLWVFSAIFITIAFNTQFSGSDTLSAGTFGDMFGAINALFSAFAFAAFLITMWMQKEELHDTRQELYDQKKALQDQVIILKQQTEIIRKQSELAEIQTNLMKISPKIEALNKLIKHCDENLEELCQKHIKYYEDRIIKYGEQSIKEVARETYDQLKRGNHFILRNNGGSWLSEGIVKKYNEFGKEKDSYVEELKKIQGDLNF